MNDEMVYVRLLDEGIDVFRPVPADWISGDVARLSPPTPPSGESWEFSPGSIVRVELRLLGENTVPVGVVEIELVDTFPA